MKVIDALSAAGCVAGGRCAYNLSGGADKNAFGKKVFVNGPGHAAENRYPTMGQNFHCGAGRYLPPVRLCRTKKTTGCCGARRDSMLLIKPAPKGALCTARTFTRY